VINPESAGKERNQLTKAVVLAIRELMRQTDTDEHTKDLAAFIALALESVAEGIDSSVEAWEKRGYWLKADRFRMDWAWTERLGKDMRLALQHDDWPKVAMTAALIAEKLSNVEVPVRHRLGTPWEGAWERLQQPNQRV